MPKKSLTVVDTYNNVLAYTCYTNAQYNYIFKPSCIIYAGNSTSVTFMTSV